MQRKAESRDHFLLTLGAYIQLCLKPVYPRIFLRGKPLHSLFDLSQFEFDFCYLLLTESWMIQKA